jgi:hypothetical protein
LKTSTVAVTAILCLSALFLACGKKDIENPVVTLANLHDLDTISPGVMTVKAVATDDKEVRYVQFHIDGALFIADSEGVADTFKFTWDTSADTLGAWHTVTARAFDTRDSSTDAGARINVRTTVVPRSTIAGPPYDGGFTFARRFLPDSTKGMLFGRNTTAAVGVFTSPETLVCRGLYRFDISTWTAGDVRLHLSCRDVTGSPGPVDVYCVPDFDTIPTPGGWADVGYWIALKDSGELATTVPAFTAGWMSATVPAATVARWKSAANGLALCVCAHDEAMLPSHYYNLETYETTPSGMNKPFLSW